MNVTADFNVTTDIAEVINYAREQHPLQGVMLASIGRMTAGRISLVTLEEVDDDRQRMRIEIRHGAACTLITSTWKNSNPLRMAHLVTAGGQEAGPILTTGIGHALIALRGIL